MLLSQQQQQQATYLSAKNRMGQTPYDVAQLNVVLQYLLPIQLQAETQAALDNGGVGLPQGIDLGGLKISNRHLPPPATLMGGGMPQSAPGGGPTQVYPPTPGMQQQGPSAQVYAPTPGFSQQQPPAQEQQNPAPVNTFSGGMPEAISPQGNASGGPALAPTSGSRPPSAPVSSGSQHSYALTGRSSAAIYRSKSGIKPDSFHSSSSDKSLQEKYGHVHGNPGAAKVPPPPSSGNSITGGGTVTAAGAGLLPSSAPPPLNGPNPFAAGGFSALRGVGGRSNRYVAYDPVTERSQLPLPPTRMATPPAPLNHTNFRTFTPGAPQQQGGDAAEVTLMIGRLIVRQLLDSNLDATIVAIVRDYDKACRVLYDDILVVKSRQKGPKLQIVLGDLIPPEELPAYKDDEKRAWLKRATSAAKLYRTDVTDYDNRDEGNDPEPDEGLAEAIRGCTIISCVGSVRPTNLWTDFLARPVWRLMRKDVSDCTAKQNAHCAPPGTKVHE